MKIKKVVLTAVAALSLFATGAATATSSMTSVTANASARKAHKRAAKKYSFKTNWLSKVESKGHKTFYYNTVKKSPKITLFHARGEGWNFTPAPAPDGYKLLHRNTDFIIGFHNKHVYATSKLVITFVNKKHKAIKNSLFVSKGTHRISKAHFNRLLHSLTNYKIKGTK